MPRLGPASKQGLKYAAKYGPHVKAAWDLFGDKAKEAARAQAELVANRRKAFDDASVRVAGSVLRVPTADGPVFVVLAGDRPVTSYPSVQAPLPELVAEVDLDKRLTPEEWRERQLRRRAAEAGRRTVAKGRGAVSARVRRSPKR